MLRLASFGDLDESLEPVKFGVEISCLLDEVNRSELLFCSQAHFDQTCRDLNKASKI